METKIIYTTPKSHLQLNTREFEPSIYCEHSMRVGTWREILNTSGEYDTMKYIIIRVKSYPLTVRAPRVHGTYNHIFGGPIERKKLDIVGEINLVIV